MNEQALSLSRSELDEEAAYHLWRAAARQAGRSAPAALLARARRALAVRMEIPRLLAAANVCDTLAWAVPLAILVGGLLARRYRGIEDYLLNVVMPATAVLYLFAGLSWISGRTARFLRRTLPCWLLTLAALRQGVSWDAWCLALSPAVMERFSRDELRERAWHWAELSWRAGQEERMGARAARLLRPGVAPDPAVLEAYLRPRRSAVMAVYLCGVAYLWLPAWRMAVTMAAHRPVSVPASWPAAALLLVAGAAALHHLTGWAARLWLGCAPESLRGLELPLAHLARAARIRRAMRGVLASDSDQSLARAAALLWLPAGARAKGLLDRLLALVFAEE